MAEYCIFESGTEHQALQVQELLESAGIGCYVKNLYTQNLFGWGNIFGSGDPIGGSIQVIIDEKNTDQAMKALEPFFGKDLPEDEQEGTL